MKKFLIAATICLLAGSNFASAANAATAHRSHRSGGGSMMSMMSKMMGSGMMSEVGGMIPGGIPGTDSGGLGQSPASIGTLPSGGYGPSPYQ